MSFKPRERRYSVQSPIVKKKKKAASEVRFKSGYKSVFVMFDLGMNYGNVCTIIVKTRETKKKKDKKNMCEIIHSGACPARCSISWQTDDFPHCSARLAHLPVLPQLITVLCPSPNTPAPLFFLLLFLPILILLSCQNRQTLPASFTFSSC